MFSLSDTIEYAVRPEKPNFERFSVNKYLFKLRATDTIFLPTYKGAVFHGGLGHALNKISPTWYQQLFEPDFSELNNSPGKVNTNWPKPFVLLPPLDETMCYQAGEFFEFELTLFGFANHYFSICHAAIDYLGKQLGLGKNSGKYLIDSVSIASTPTTDESKKCLLPFQPPINGEQIVKLGKLNNTQKITLYFPTRLRIKANNKLCKQAPAFHIIVDRVIGRLNTIAHYYGTGQVVNKELRQYLQHTAQQIVIQQHNLQWQEWQRTSNRQKQSMSFGGLLGTITYEGELTPFLPYLLLAEWLHIGGKTSFGFGKYIIGR